jgi:hypothetical protein
VNVDAAANHFPVSLPPYERVKTFPVVTYGPTEIHLLGLVSSALGGASLVFDSIHAERLRIAPQNLRWARDFILGPPKDTVAKTER